MERKLSGLDLIELKQFNKEVIETSEKNFFTSKKERASFVAQALQKLDPKEDVDHMFVDENALRLTDEPIQVVKKTKWTHVFDAVQHWPKMRDKHS